MPIRLPAAIFTRAVTVLAAGLAVASSSGPPVGNTGAPKIGGIAGDTTCNRSGCHAGNPLNNTSGKVEILGLPASYAAGMTYPLTVRLTSSSTTGSPGRRWGFQLTCCLASDGRGLEAGGFTVPPGILALEHPVKDRVYVSQSASTLQQGASAPVEWAFEWTAPAAPRGTILFFVAGNAANGNGSTSGDFIYATADSVAGATVPVGPVSWGKLKAGAP